MLYINDNNVRADHTRSSTVCAVRVSPSLRFDRDTENKFLITYHRVQYQRKILLRRRIVWKLKMPLSFEK